MSWFYLYRQSDGALLSESSVNPGETAAGVAVIEETARKSQTHDWDASVPGWVERAQSDRVAVQDLFGLMTEAEQAAFWALDPLDSTAQRIDGAIARAERLTGGKVRKSHPATGAIFDLLIAAGVLTAERKTEILS